ncbi:unnamed protein product [Didymodactylos carnosus]|uniref:Uncharacterized protein n=1 Tax=Didymodactylos carnosus TaxID=1234261 RepID=A0A815XGN6_9BILA|nr:unnamed protein product [Didymodactylos carnosus]CAF4418850.1 unnamed protein product [Didymodactylos carnosus]
MVNRNIRQQLIDFYKDDQSSSIIFKSKCSNKYGGIKGTGQSFFQFILLECPLMSDDDNEEYVIIRTEKENQQNYDAKQATYTRVKEKTLILPTADQIFRVTYRLYTAHFPKIPNEVMIQLLKRRYLFNQRDVHKICDLLNRTGLFPHRKRHPNDPAPPTECDFITSLRKYEVFDQENQDPNENIIDNGSDEDMDKSADEKLSDDGEELDDSSSSSSSSNSKKEDEDDNTTTVTKQTPTAPLQQTITLEKQPAAAVVTNPDVSKIVDTVLVQQQAVIAPSSSDLAPVAAAANVPPQQHLPVVRRPRQRRLPEAEALKNVFRSWNRNY